MTQAEQAGWKQDPFGRHELRYWDGSAWTQHVSDAGVTSTDEPVPNDPAAPPPPPPAPGAAAAGGAGGSWKDRLKAAAQQAAVQGKELAEKGKTFAAEQQAARAAAAANDPNVVWTGEKKSIGTSAVGIASVRYRITHDKVYVDSGVLGTTSEQVPLWAVNDVDVRQNMMQSGKNIGDVVLHLDQATYSGLAELVLDNIEDPYGVRDLVNPLVSEARAKKQMLTQTQYVQHSGSMFGGQAAGAAPAGPGSVDIADQLRKLAELRDEGILTDEEFALQKQRLLGG
ncbi:MAG TPA: PH domain-containing protein [Acidimicrobiales bacterium]|jgi:hypothetical protein|nr:PH domain-containing protein [Acidimicrobiales bacterium]